MSSSIRPIDTLKMEREAAKLRLMHVTEEMLPLLVAALDSSEPTHLQRVTVEVVDHNMGLISNWWKHHLFGEPRFVRTSKRVTCWKVGSIRRATYTSSIDPWTGTPIKVWAGHRSVFHLLIDVDSKALYGTRAGGCYIGRRVAPRDRWLDHFEVGCAFELLTTAEINELCQMIERHLDDLHDQELP